MTRDELLSLTPDDINRMSKEELYQLAKAEQKSLRDARRRLRKAGLDTPALRIYEEGTISAKKNMTAGELKSQVMKGQIMMRYKTGTVTEARKVESSLLEAVGKRVGGELTSAESKNMWKIIDRLAETKPGLLGITDPDYIPVKSQMIAYDFVKDKGLSDSLSPEEVDEAVNEAEKYFRSKYEDYELDNSEEFYEFD